MAKRIKALNARARRRCDREQDYRRWAEYDRKNPPAYWRNPETGLLHEAWLLDPKILKLLVAPMSAPQIIAIQEDFDGKIYPQFEVHDLSDEEKAQRVFKATAYFTEPLIHPGWRP